MDDKSFITSCEINNPATAGTYEMLPGVTFVPLWSSIFIFGVIGNSVENKTLTESIPLSFNNFLITFAKGQV